MICPNCGAFTTHIKFIPTILIFFFVIMIYLMAYISGPAIFWEKANGYLHDPNNQYVWGGIACLALNIVMWFRVLSGRGKFFFLSGITQIWCTTCGYEGSLHPSKNTRLPWHDD
jgi:hypothetical protein